MKFNSQEWSYYLFYFNFRFKEPLSDLKSTGVTYILYCFFIWLLSLVWLKFQVNNSPFHYDQVVYYIGLTEALFMSFLSSKQIQDSTEDFALYLVRPRSWLLREFVANLGVCASKRGLFLLSLFIFGLSLNLKLESPMRFWFSALGMSALLSVHKALFSMVFSALRLNYQQTDYFILPFGKLFLALGGVFGPLSDYGEPWRSWLLKLPGSDLFFQPAYFCIHGEFYQMSGLQWILRISLIAAILWGLTIFFYHRGRSHFQAWGG